MNHCHVELIEDPQWVSYSVDNRCSGTTFTGLCVVRTALDTCATVRNAMHGPASGDTASSCPVADLLMFHKPQVEFRGSYFMAQDNIEFGYGGLECTPNLKRYHSEVEINQSILKASLPSMIALFSTTLTERFTREYEIVNNAPGATLSGAPCLSWMTVIYELARQIELRPRATYGCSTDKMSIVSTLR